MKWFIIPAIAASIFSVHASHISQGHHQTPNNIAKDLNLTSEQQAKFKDIRFTFLKRVIHEVHQDTLDFSEHQKALGEIAEQIKGILTKDQYAKLEKQGGVHAILDMQLAHEELFNRLNADEAQLTKLRSMMKETHKTIEAVQAQKLPPAETQKQMKETIRLSLEKMKTILTPDQLKKAFELIGGKA